MELQTGGGQRGIGSKVPFAGEENADGIVVGVCGVRHYYLDESLQKVIVLMKDKNPYLKSYKLNSIFMVIKCIKTRF